MDAHHVGLVHRDIKPANLFLCKKGLRSDWVKELDFGLVSLKGGNTDAPTLTAHGFAGGTPAFMAPEQAAGQAVDGRGDIYALGCVAYWLLSGQLVFEGDGGLAVIVAHARDEPPAISSMTELDIPDDLEALVMRCLDKDPTARPQTAQALAEALAGLACATDWTRANADHWWKMHHPDSGSS
jgi:serine/threonine protein kinase